MLFDGKIEPQSLLIYTGSEINLHCHSSSRPSWLYFEERIPLGQLFNGGFSVRVVNASTYHSGRYVCQGTLRNQLKFTAFSFVYVGGKILYCIATFELSVCSIATSYSSCSQHNW